MTGLIFLGSIFLVEYVLLPLVHTVLYHDSEQLQKTIPYALNLAYRAIGLCFEVALRRARLS